MLQQDLRHARQQPGAIGSDHSEDAVLRVVATTQADLRADREMFDTPADAPLQRRWQRFRADQRRPQFVFDQVDNVAVTAVVACRIQHQKHEQVVVATRGVQTRLDDAVPGTLEKAATTGEQVVALGAVDQHLQSLADG